MTAIAEIDEYRSRRRAYVKRQAELRLEKTDFKVIRAIERGETPERAWTIWRQALRNIINDPEYVEDIPEEPTQ